MKKHILVAAAILAAVACSENKGSKGNNSAQEEPVASFSKKWSAQEIYDSWTHQHQDTCTVKSYWMEDGNLCIRTRANTYDRQKLYSKQIYTYGTYKWKTYIPRFGKGDMTSVGSWIYCDDHHEIDFEVGYGKAADRQKANATEDQCLAYMTCQDFPWTSTYVPISYGWHEFSIKLGGSSGGNYQISWIIDGKEVKQVDGQFGSNNAVFRIFVSVENLLFIGDQIASQDNVGKYEWASFEGETI